MKTTVVGTIVDVTVWARRPEVAEVVTAASGQLEGNLREAGLVLRAFHVLEGVRPDPLAPIDAPRTSGLDLKA
jgi:hypothetical protein